MALASFSCEVVWILKISHPSLASLYCDSKIALSLAANPAHRAWTKHVEIDCHFIREQIAKGIIQMFYVSLANQLADIFTKALDKSQFQFLLSKLGTHNIHTPA